MESSDISIDKSPQYSIVVFSKDRPLQLHAYLESLLLFSDALPQNITVIYKYSEGINYAKVISHFPLINWHNQGDFYSDLMTAVSSSGKYILFGCDDVVFIRVIREDDDKD